MRIVNSSYEILSEIDSEKMMKSIEIAGRTCYKSENKITMDSAGIALESPKNITIKATEDVIIDGKNVTLAANVQFKASGNAGAELSTGAIAKIQGSMVKIN